MLDDCSTAADLSTRIPSGISFCLPFCCWLCISICRCKCRGVDFVSPAAGSLGSQGLHMIQLHAAYFATLAGALGPQNKNGEWSHRSHACRSECPAAQLSIRITPVCLHRLPSLQLSSCMLCMYSNTERLMLSQTEEAMHCRLQKQCAPQCFVQGALTRMLGLSALLGRLCRLLAWLARNRHVCSCSICTSKAK